MQHFWQKLLHTGQQTINIKQTAPQQNDKRENHKTLLAKVHLQINIRAHQQVEG